MKLNDKMSMRGAINALKIKGRIELPAKEYRLSSVRSTANALKNDTGKAFSVSKKGEIIVVTRKS